MRRLGLLCVCVIGVLVFFSSPVLAPTNTAVVDTDFEACSIGVGESLWGNGQHQWEKLPGTWDVIWDGVQYTWMDLGGGNCFYEADGGGSTLRIRVTEGAPRTYEMSEELPATSEDVYDHGEIHPQ